MSEPLIIAIYFIAVSILAAAVTLHDKSAAKKSAWRVKESTLLLISILGGSVSMLVTMKAIRHKTKHLKFMVGIPVIIALQITALIYVYIQFTTL